MVQRVFGQEHISNHVRAENLARIPEARQGWVDLAAMGYGDLGDSELVYELSAKLISGHTDGLSLTSKVARCVP